VSDDDTTAELNVAAWQARSAVNGPGERFVLWVQGCPFRCPGCFNPDFLPSVEAQRMTIAEVAGLVGRVSGLEGVTYSGGEPMAQARGLYRLSRLLRQRGLTVVSYSGYTLEELHALGDPWVMKLLGCLDVLIDGRFDAGQRANLPWRGSHNQRVHFLTDAYRHLAERVQEARTDVELVVGRGGFVSTGIFSPALLGRLERVLRGEKT
jgi:anaerobic ribonucleoside-triphosphate reductase activating protein